MSKSMIKRSNTSNELSGSRRVSRDGMVKDKLSRALTTNDFR